MLIFLLIFSTIHAYQGAPTPISDVDTAYLWQRTLTCPSTRSSTNILFSCLATIFACTWSSIHPNIPAPTDCKWTVLKRRILTMVYALLAPEMVVLWAMRQRFMAKRIKNSYNAEIKRAPVSYGLYREGDVDSPRKWFNDASLPLPLERGQARQWTTTHGFFILMGGFMLSEKGVLIQVLPYFTDSLDGDQGAEGLKNLINQGIIYPPTITEVDINDRSKGDTISKTVVILQTTWFILQCVMRWSRGLGVTELEVVTLGFAMLNGIIYALWWNKPQSVGVPVYLEKIRTGRRRYTERERPRTRTRTTRRNEPDPVPPTASNTPILTKRSWFRTKLAKDRGKHSLLLFWIFDVPSRLVVALLRPLGKMWRNAVVAEGALRVPMFYSAVNDDYDAGIIFLVSSSIAVLFGLIHLVPSWSLAFPSPTEMHLWRVSAIAITVQPIVMALCAFFGQMIGTGSKLLTVGIPFFLGLLIFYIFSRITLIILAFVSLRALPFNAHLTIDWVSSIPHF